VSVFKSNSLLFDAGMFCSDGSRYCVYRSLWISFVFVAGIDIVEDGAVFRHFDIGLLAIVCIV